MWNFISSIPFVISRDGGKGDSTTLPPGHDRNDNNDKRDDDDLMRGTGSNIPLLHCALAGAFGGVIGDSVMHSLDTVKTRQQGAPKVSKYRNMLHAYNTIYIEEGVTRGLYGGYTAAMLGSLPSAGIFFYSYEWTKRLLIDDWGWNDTTSHLIAGFTGDFVSSIVYVPSEVLKSRLQLQGRFNNGHFYSGYNYHNLRDAIRTIVRIEGYGALYFGYRATLVRDLPFSALQFAFYEKFRQWAFKLEGKLSQHHDLSIANEILAGAAAGGLAGIITTPLDVIKTRLQTQQQQPSSAASSKTSVTHSNTFKSTLLLQSNAIGKNLQLIYRNEGLWNLFNGVGPRFVWTSVQSSIMLLLYQTTLKFLNKTTYLE